MNIKHIITLLLSSLTYITIFAQINSTKFFFNPCQNGLDSIVIINSAGAATAQEIKFNINQMSKDTMYFKGSTVDATVQFTKVKSKYNGHFLYYVGKDTICNAKFKNGKLDGMLIEKFGKDGYIVKHYKNGMQEGLESHILQNELRYLCHYKNNKKNGIELVFYPEKRLKNYAIYRKGKLLKGEYPELNFENNGIKTIYLNNENGIKKIEVNTSFLGVPLN